MKKIVRVKDFYQEYEYEITEPMGKNFSPIFKPDLTPKQMLDLGVFGGLYFGDKPKEFPKEWFEKAQLSPNGISHKELNFFNVDASLDIKEWRKNGWIHRDDPRGWFQWYCRYYMGRRHKDDERQIKRWKNMWRHISQILNNCQREDFSCRKRQRQAVMHWAYDSRKM